MASMIDESKPNATARADDGGNAPGGARPATTAAETAQLGPAEGGRVRPEPANAASGVDPEAGPPAGEPPVFAAPDRPRGLDAWFAPGGVDDADAGRRADERRMLRLLFLMVALLVAVPTILTVIAFVGEIVARGSGGG